MTNVADRQLLSYNDSSNCNITVNNSSANAVKNNYNKVMIKNSRKRIAKNIIKNIPSVTAWVFSFLANMTEVTIEAFLNPSYYADLPNGFYNPKWKSGSEKKQKLKFKKDSLRQSVRRLQKQGFVEKKGGRYILTDAGKKLMKYIKTRKKILKKKWDRKYRVVIFDIPEKKRWFRSWLRNELYLLNYRQLQKSVFIGKYPLTKDLIGEINRKEVAGCVNYMLVEKLYDQRKIKDL